MPRSLLPIVLLTLGLAACGGGGGSGAPEEAALPDGRHFGYIQTLEESTLTFDAADFLTGRAATEAALEDGAIDEGEPVPNDYYIRNADRATVELRLADEVGVTAARCRGACREGIPGDLGGLAASFSAPGEKTLADDYRGAKSQYWVTLEDGLVVAIDEQYLP